MTPVSRYDDALLCETAAAALSDWGLSAQELSVFSHSENIVLRAEAGGDTYALRLHRPGYHTLDELNSEVMWHDMVRAAGLETPIAVPAVNGDYYSQVRMPGSEETRYVGLTRWIDGTVLADFVETSPDAAARRGYFRQLGHMMATMHKHSSEWSPPPHFVRHALDAEGLMGPNPFWGRFWEASPASAPQKQVLDNARGYLHRFLCALDKDPDRYGVIHADLHASNIMIDKNRVIVFDFDDAGFGWYLYDIATAVFDAWFDDDDYLNTYEGLIEGYVEVRPFTNEMRELMPKFLLARLLAYVGWLDNRPENQSYSFLPELTARACERATEICR